MIRKLGIVICFAIISISGFSSGRDDASFVWTDSIGTGRQLFVYFRHDVTLDSKVASAEINLFADSRYQLFVNGQMINFGPSRFYPKHPDYDTYNLIPYLKEGKNTIAVKVLSNGVVTFQVPKHIGGFIAWGEIKTTNGKSISLSSPGNWLCRPANGYDREMPKVSFALHIVESFDARQDQPDWNLPACDTKDWKKPVLIAKQNEWGKLSPRIIPHLTQDEVTMKKLLGVYTLNDDNDIYTYRIKVPDENEQLYRSSYRLFAYTYIYSPKAQKIDMDGWWSENWLNGDSMSYTQLETGLPKRVWHMNLKEGWNYLFVKYGTFEGIWEAFYIVPKKYGLIFSADKNKESDVAFYTAGPFLGKDENKKIKSVPLPLSSPDQLPKMSVSWIPQKKNEIIKNPVWEIVWNTLGEKLPYHSSHSGAITIDKPSAFLYDIGSKQLARFSIDINASEGTIVDVSFTEDSVGNRPWVMKRRMVSMGARFITREGTNHFETFNPYGARFVHLNVIPKNNASVTVQKVNMISQIYPFEKKGSFECSDPLFNSLWEMGWRTLQVCSEDSYDDTPFRERGLYAGDCLPEFATTLATSGDPRLIKRSLELFQDMYVLLFDSTAIPSSKEERKNANSLGDFPLITTLYFNWYVMQTGDWEFARKFYTNYKYMIQRTYAKNTQANGLIEFDNVFVEWSKIRRNKYSNTFGNAIYARNCDILAAMAEKLGNTTDAKWFKNKSASIVQALQKNCWDDNKGAFRDGMVKDSAINSFYPISSSIMSLFGYTTPEQENKLTVFYDVSLKDIGNKVRDGLATSYGGFYVLGGLYRHGNVSIAEHFIRRYWSPMLNYLDDTMWEDFSENSELLTSGTLSHAWSSAPTYYMTTQTLGIQLGFPVDVNMTNVLIQPQAESITWAKGTVPHPKGNIHVDWSVKGENLFLNYTAPSELNVTVTPRGKLAEYKLWVNGIKK